MVSKKIIIPVAIVLILIAVGVGFYIYSDSGISVNPKYPIRINVPSTSSATDQITIENNEDQAYDFIISSKGLDNILTIEKTEVTLNSGESQTIQLNFAEPNEEPNIYVGKIIVESSLGKTEVPVIINFENMRKTFTIIQDESSSHVNKGDELKVEVKIFDLNSIDMKEVKISHMIKNLNDEIIYSEQGSSVMIEGKYNFVKSIEVQEDLEIGNYVMITSVEYNNVTSQTGNIFEVREKDYLTGWEIPILIGMVFVVIVIVLFYYFIKSRDELLIKLKEQQDKELDKKLQLVEASRLQVSKIKVPKERAVKLKQLSQTKKEVIKCVKEKQKAQIKELKKIRKKKKKSEVERQLDKWKKEGFDLVETKKQVKKATSAQRRKNELKSFKSQGYDTSMFK